METAQAGTTENEAMDLNRLCPGCMGRREDPDAPCPDCSWAPDGQNLPHQLGVGSVLNGKYLVGRALGQGGFGITYIAWDIPAGAKAAIKEYYPSDSVTRQGDLYTVKPYASQGVPQLFAEGRDKFFSEAQSLARFESVPGIVSVRDFFRENGTAYIVMEFVEGRTLAQYLDTLGRPLLIADALALLGPVADSLEQVHAAGLLHRDISPDNIMITDTGEAKLLDFGASRAFSLQGERSNTVNIRMGYAPKEQYLTHGEQGPWTDVYALAATVYRAITGVTPVQSLDREPSDLLPRPSALGAELNPQQEAVLLRGMAVSHRNRYRSVREFYDAMLAAGSGARVTVTGGASQAARTAREAIGRVSGKVAGSGLVQRIKARPKPYRALILCICGAAWILACMLFSNAFAYQAERYLDNPTVNLTLPVLLSLVPLAAYIIELLNYLKSAPLRFLTDQKKQKAALIAQCALCAAAFLMCAAVEDLAAILLLYATLSCLGVFFGCQLLAKGE